MLGGGGGKRKVLALIDFTFPWMWVFWSDS